MVALGWSGQWTISFARDNASSLHVRAGMELTHLRLHSGEEIRTPRMLLLFWKGGDYIVGHNLLRRFVIAHLMPRKDGEPVTLPFACSSSPLYDEANRATEVNQIDFASRFQQYGVEYLWIDAGWFEGGGQMASAIGHRGKTVSLRDLGQCRMPSGSLAWVCFSGLNQRERFRAHGLTGIIQSGSSGCEKIR